MKLWTNKDITDIEKKAIETKQWANSNRRHASVKISPDQLLGLATLIEQTVEEIKHYKSKVEEMQKTLEWYADPSNWIHDEIECETPANCDEGKLARQALKGESQ